MFFGAGQPRANVRVCYTPSSGRGRSLWVLPRLGRRLSGQRLFLLVLLVVLGMGTMVVAGDWTCPNPQTSGIHVRLLECQLTDQVVLTGNLAVTGQSESNLTVVRANATKRHFYAGNTYILTLKWLRLTGSDIVNSGDTIPHECGGAVYVYSSACLTCNIQYILQTCQLARVCFQCFDDNV